MRKFKLIKKYPGSPELNTELIEENNHYFYFSPYGDFGSSRNTIESKFVLKYPEHFQEVIEKDYEILSFVRKDDSKVIFYPRENGLYSTTNKGQLKESDLLVDHIQIHSVKRLSGGEVFTIGDTVDGYISNTIKNPTWKDKVISKIELNSLGIVFWVDWNNYPGTVPLNYIQKAKQKLFTTKDGVDIFEGDKAWCVYPADFYMWEHTFSLKSSDNRKIFSTKEKAEEYILMNKPCLSITDLVTISNGSYHRLSDDIIVKLVQSKLKL